MSQHELIIKYCEEYGKITPALMSGKIYYDIMFGSETSKRCRELRKRGILDSKPEGRFEVFFLKREVKQEQLFNTYCFNN